MMDCPVARRLSLVSLVLVLVCAFVRPVAASDDVEIPLRIGGVGGVYFLAEPGTLVVDVEKRDLNRRGRRTELQAILVGPDRQVLQQITLPDDGKPRSSGMGPRQRGRLSVPVQRKGVYGLNVTVSQDRYGEEIAWGFRTNCPHYLIETARGHRDRRREEPIVLLNPDRPGDICFLPRTGRFGVEVANVPDGAEALRIYDEDDTLIHTMPVDESGKASHTFSGDTERGACPWRLHLPAHQATVQIDGVTRWDKGDRYPNLPYWTPEPTSYFPFQEYRWILTPYSRTAYAQPGEQAEIAFQVHNNAGAKRTIRLDLEFPDAPWPARLSTERVAVGAKQAVDVKVHFTAPPEGQTRVCHVRATPAEDPSFSTYSTLTVKAGASPAAQALEMPIVLRPYQHENEQFGYLPAYPVDNQMYFDVQNQPFVRTSKGIATRREGRWADSDLQSTVRSSTAALRGKAFGLVTTKLAFDRDNDLYAVAMTGRQAALLCSDDNGATFSAYPISGREDRPRVFDIEQFSGHNVPDGPPPVLRYTRTAADPRLIWRRINDLELILYDKTDAGLTAKKPILISRKCIGLSVHSGIASTVVSRGSKVHIAWGEATDPNEKVPGVPTYVATYDRETEELGVPVLVGYGPPANDIHNTPSITMDSRGYLHVLVGTHGRPFQYVRSLSPNEAQGGWTKPAAIGEDLRQTYVGLVCGADDTLHCVFRLWRSSTDPFPASHHAVLAYQRKEPGKPWEPPQTLIVSPFSEYSIFYHRLTIDRAGRLFLSYDYWSTYWFYRTDHRGTRRALLTSADSGATWRFAQEQE